MDEPSPGRDLAGWDEQVEAFDRHTADQLARSSGETPLFHLSLPLSADLMHAISRGVTEELGRMGYRVLIGEGGRVFAKPKTEDDPS